MHLLTFLHNNPVKKKIYFIYFFSHFMLYFLSFYTQLNTTYVISVSFELQKKKKSNKDIKKV